MTIIPYISEPFKWQRSPQNRCTTKQWLFFLSVWIWQAFAVLKKCPIYDWQLCESWQFKPQGKMKDLFTHCCAMLATLSHGVPSPTAWMKGHFHEVPSKVISKFPKALALLGGFKCYTAQQNKDIPTWTHIGCCENDLLFPSGSTSNACQQHDVSVHKC